MTGRRPRMPIARMATRCWSTSGAVAASADELLAYGQALFGGRVVSASSLAAMSDFTTYDYGMGLLRVWPDEQTAVGHTGGMRGFVSLLLRFPDPGFTV